jgi:hypothetical protein
MPRNRIMMAALIAVAGVIVSPSSPASADTVPPRFRITSSISLTMLDKQVSPRPDARCTVNGTTSQETTRTNVTLPLGTGTPGVDYPANRGPFRDTLNNPILFVCGDVSVCFPSAGVVVRADGTAEANIPVSFHVGGTVPCDNSTRKGFLRILPMTAPGGGQTCGIVPPLVGPNLDRIDFGPVCLASVQLPPQLTITRFDCFSVDSEYTCAVGYGGHTGAVAIRWFLNGSQTPTAALNNLTSFTRRCAPNYQVRVRVTLTDATGRLVERSTSFRCLGDELP